MQLPENLATEILKVSGEAVVVADGNGTIVFVSSLAEALFGYSSDELLGNPIEMLIPAAARSRHEELRRNYRKAPRARPLLSGLSLEAQRKDGTVFAAEIALTPFVSINGVHVVSTIRKIGSMDVSDAFFRNLLDAAPDAMVIVDAHGKIAIVNAQAEEMFGYPRDQLFGSSIEMLMPERFHERHQDHRTGYFVKPKLREMGLGMELAGLRSDGSEFPVEISLSPITTSSGLFISSVIRDVTDRRNMELALVSARQAAERANKANSAFLAAASHDLRQPVQALALLNGALRRIVSEPMALEIIQSQQDSLDGMTNLLNSLLDISRLDAGAVQPEVEDFLLGRLLGRLSAEFSRQAKKKELVFHTDPCDLIVRSDPHLLAEIIQNLISNAIRYTEQGSVGLHCLEKDGTVWVTVTDTGIGIDPEQFDNIFREFHQIRSPGGKREGVGLGLAIARRLANLIGHEIRVESTPGVGSSFSIGVPRSFSRHALPGPEMPRSETPGLAPQGLVLLIEDDDKVAQAWGLLLRSAGFRVLIAGTASEARAQVRDVPESPQLIISDYHLPEGANGIATVAAIRIDLASTVPAFIITGDTSKIGYDPPNLDNIVIMRKPVSPDHMLRLAREAILSGSVADSG
jgi:two-component system, sensor histidine kinase